MPPVDPFVGNFSTKTMKSIAKWADTNRDGKLVDTELDKGRERLGNMKLSASQKKWYQQQHKAVPENFLAAFGHYLEAAREAKKIDYSSGTPLKREVFFINAIDQISKYDGNSQNISSSDWYRYTNRM
ncbi:MAG: hypothetical protein QE263_07355 [Vampirovibrionales bacterium]|nr:hypothetical protein [Vampirovibrionales bacterium]